MSTDAIPLFAMIRGKLGHLAQRERLIAQNVANADTPGFTPTDLKPFAAVRETTAMRAIAPSQTSAGHMAGLKPAPQGGFKAIDAPDSETTLDGNRVVLEDQMLKMAESRLEYDAAIGFYQKSLAMLRIASRAPGR